MADTKMPGNGQMAAKTANSDEVGAKTPDLTGLDDTARTIITRLGLSPHPEGGWYVRDWQAGGIDPASGRPLASLIYFLLPQGDASAWHVVDADELWLWHGPAPLTLELGGSGEHPAPAADGSDRIALGPVAQGGAGHAVVPKGVWQRTLPGTGDVLVSCVVSPGFVYSGFALDSEK